MSDEFEPAQSRTEAALQNLLGANNELDPPQSRVEAILQNMLGANHELEPPQSREEALLQQILEQGGSGGGTTPTGTKNISITQNGTTTENVADYASASISVNVPNPNSYEAISGTLSNPWGNINPSDLMAEMKADSGYFGNSISNVIFALTIPNMGTFYLPVALDNWNNNPTAFIASALNYAPALGESTPQGGCLVYGANGALLSAYMYVNGTLTDVASQMAQAPTSLIVFRHPLSES